MNVLKLIAGLFLCTFLISCGPEIEKQDTAAKPELIRIPEPFRYHKAIEVKPGLTFDIVSWGRGSDSIGAYLILRSDSTRLSYRSVSGELKGQVFDTWNMDLDNDGNPELYIQSVEKGNDNHLKMYIHEFSDGGSSQPIRFPELNSSLKEGYRGKDSLYVRDGILYREFAFHSAKDSASAVKPLKRKLEYFLKNNSLQFKEIKEDRQSSDKKQ